MSDVFRHVDVPEPRAKPDHPMAKFFEGLRRARRKHYARRQPPGRARKRGAVLTMVHNESVFLPLWLRYYSRFFAPRTSTSSTTTRPTVRRRAGGSSGSRSPTTRSTTPGWCGRSRTQHELLDRYDVGAGHRRGRDRRPVPSGGPRRVHRSVRRGVRQLPRLRADSPGGPGAALRPLAADPRPARLLVRERRLRQAGAGDRADALGAGLPRARRPANAASTPTSS